MQSLRVQPEGEVITNQIQTEWVCYNCFKLIVHEWIKGPPSLYLALMELICSLHFSAGVLYKMYATALCFVLPMNSRA